nr:uncharacterized protein LOC131274168 [Dasypus novemcinctus]
MHLVKTYKEVPQTCGADRLCGLGHLGRTRTKRRRALWRLKRNCGERGCTLFPAQDQPQIWASVTPPYTGTPQQRTALTSCPWAVLDPFLPASGSAHPCRLLAKPIPAGSWLSPSLLAPGSAHPCWLLARRSSCWHLAFPTGRHLGSRLGPMCGSWGTDVDWGWPPALSDIGTEKLRPGRSARFPKCRRLKLPRHVSPAVTRTRRDSPGLPWRSASLLCGCGSTCETSSRYTDTTEQDSGGPQRPTEYSSSTLFLREHCLRE